MTSLVVPERPLTDWQSLAEQFYSYLVTLGRRNGAAAGGPHPL